MLSFDSGIELHAALKALSASGEARSHEGPVGELMLLIVVAALDPREVLLDILKIHPEDTIVFVGPAELLLV